MVQQMNVKRFYNNLPFNTGYDTKQNNKKDAIIYLPKKISYNAVFSKTNFISASCIANKAIEIITSTIPLGLLF